jgi:type IV secretory pathway VirB2 component (pilin)
MSILSTLYQLAVTIDPSDIGYTSPQKDPNDAIAGILNTVYLVAGMVAVITIVIAGMVYVTSRGDPGKVKQARNAIVGALVGLVIVMSAFVITQFIIRGVTQ